MSAVTCSDRADIDLHALPNGRPAKRPAGSRREPLATQAHACFGASARHAGRRWCVGHWSATEQMLCSCAKCQTRQCITLSLSACLLYRRCATCCAGQSAAATVCPRTGVPAIKESQLSSDIVSGRDACAQWACVPSHPREGPPEVPTSPRPSTIRDSRRCSDALASG
jgi:hypothetical protein